MLVGHYIAEAGYDIYYYDEQTGDVPSKEILDNQAVYLLAHNPEVTYGDQLDTVPGWYGNHTATDCDGALAIATGNGTPLQFAKGSVVLDPWRKTPEIADVEVIHYGNTRGKR
tara:strand:- start:3940 stop:4278 length:339 start_codon:yes stop_codon:yes gene_type:complete